MAKIGLGTFGLRTPGVTQVADTSAVGAAVGRIGQVVTGIGADENARRIAVARGRASNALLDHRIQIDQKVGDIEERVRTGQLNYEDARRVYDEEIADLQPPGIEHLDRIATEGLQRGVKQNAFIGSNVVDRLVSAARRQDLQSQFNTGLDNLGKLAGSPGADIDSINQQAGAFAPLAIAGGVPKDQVERALQSFKDRNWQNQAVQRMAAERDSLPGLRQLEHDLVAADGFYSGKLDTDKRNAVLASVMSRRDVLENKIRIEADRREAGAERAVAQIDRQIASGVPATPAMWADWERSIRGTGVEPEFRQLIADEQQVQQVLRAPVQDQLAFVQAREQELLQQGGTLRDAANLARLKGAVKQNVNLLQQAPLQFYENRTGTDVAPLDLSVLGEEDGGRQIAEQLQDRVVTLRAMRKQYGNQVQLRPLLPQEAQMLGAVLEQASPRQAATVFGELRQAVGDDEIYSAAIQQIAPDSPVKALAGMLAAKERSLTLERNWIGDDVVASSADVSSTLLAGEAILNATKAGKGADGKPDKGLFMPGDGELQEQFAARMGNAFANRPGAADLAFQAVKAYYAGKAAQTGKIAQDSKDVDGALVREAIRATLGEVVDFNGHGEVLAPWGMTESQFEDAAEGALLIEMKRRGMPATEAGARQIGQVGLRNQGEGTYYVTSGRNFVFDAQGQPLVINVLAPGAEDRRGVIQRPGP